MKFTSIENMCSTWRWSCDDCVLSAIVTERPWKNYVYRSVKVWAKSSQLKPHDRTCSAAFLCHEVEFTSEITTYSHLDPKYHTKGKFLRLLTIYTPKATFLGGYTTINDLDYSIKRSFIVLGSSSTLSAPHNVSHQNNSNLDVVARVWSTRLGAELILSTNKDVGNFL